MSEISRQAFLNGVQFSLGSNLQDQPRENKKLHCHNFKAWQTINCEDPLLYIFYLMSFVWLNWFTYRAYWIYVVAALILIIPSNEEQRQSFGRFAKALEHLLCFGILDFVDKMSLIAGIRKRLIFAAITFCSDEITLLWFKCCHNVTEPIASSGSKVYRHARMALPGIHSEAILHWTVFCYLSADAALLVLVHIEVLGGVACSGFQRAKHTHANTYWKCQQSTVRKMLLEDSFILQHCCWQ